MKRHKRLALKKWRKEHNLKKGHLYGVEEPPYAHDEEHPSQKHEGHSEVLQKDKDLEALKNDEHMHPYLKARKLR